MNADLDPKCNHGEFSDVFNTKAFLGKPEVSSGFVEVATFGTKRGSAAQ